jgi:non-specific serine/threonine protein kinase
MQQLSVKELHDFASIELFHDRAGNAKMNFVLDENNASPVAQICRRLDGIPLAIELAAARIKVLSVDEIAARLDDRFSLLTAGSRTAIPRHQTLRATIDWSYDLLTESERVLFRRLSVFTGGFTLEAAEAVCSQGMKRNDVLDLLSRLVDKSLIMVEEDAGLHGTRYRLLETIRQYALEKLVEIGEAPGIRDQHLGFYLDLAEKAEPNIFGTESATWFRWLDKELDNIRAAIEWSTNSGKADMALRIAGSLVYFWFAHGLVGSEWHDRVQQALARPEGRERTLARAKALNGLGFMYWADIYPVDRRSVLEEALSIGRELGDQWNTAAALRILGLIENIKGNYLEARTLLEQSLEIWRKLGPEGKMGRAWTLIFLGDLALNQNLMEQARSFYEEANTFLREIGDANFLAYSVRRLGQLAWRDGDDKESFTLCQESLRLNQKVNDIRGVIACLAGFAAIAVLQGKFERATKLMAAVEAQLTSIGIRLLFLDKFDYERNLTLLREKLDEKILNKFWAKGRAMSLEQTIAFALERA